MTEFTSQFSVLANEKYGAQNVIFDSLTLKENPFSTVMSGEVGEIQTCPMTFEGVRSYYCDLNPVKESGEKNGKALFIVELQAEIEYDETQIIDPQDLYSLLDALCVDGWSANATSIWYVRSLQILSRLLGQDGLQILGPGRVLLPLTVPGGGGSRHAPFAMGCVSLYWAQCPAIRRITLHYRQYEEKLTDFSEGRKYAMFRQLQGLQTGILPSSWGPALAPNVREQWIWSSHPGDALLLSSRQAISALALEYNPVKYHADLNMGEAEPKTTSQKKIDYYRPCGQRQLLATLSGDSAAQMAQQVGFGPGWYLFPLSLQEAWCSCAQWLRNLESLSPRHWQSGQLLNMSRIGDYELVLRLTFAEEVDVSTASAEWDGYWCNYNVSSRSPSSTYDMYSN